MCDLVPCLVSWVKANPKERCGMVQREVRKAEEEGDGSRL